VRVKAALVLKGPLNSPLVCGRDTDLPDLECC
jgi:hypothetical protein